MSNGNESKLESSKVCPKFSGKKEEYEAWRGKVEDWMDITEGSFKFPGLRD